MQVDVVFRWADLSPDEARGRVIVVIDVLRATSMIAALLDAGAKEVWPVRELNEAKQLAARLDGALLAGERGGVPPPGFDMGNSPREVDPGKVRGVPVVVSTTNGTAAIQRCAAAEALVTAAFANIDAVVKFLLARDIRRLLVVCAGTRGSFSLDDTLCAGGIVSRLWAAGVSELSDSAIAARLLYESQRERLVPALRSCRHGQVLEGLGMGDDIEWAAVEGRIDVVPVRMGDPRGCRLVAAGDVQSTS